MGIAFPAVGYSTVPGSLFKLQKLVGSGNVGVAPWSAASGD